MSAAKRAYEAARARQVALYGEAPCTCEACGRACADAVCDPCQAAEEALAVAARPDADAEDERPAPENQPNVRVDGVWRFGVLLAMAGLMAGMA